MEDDLPEEYGKRRLIYHPESGWYWETNSLKEYSESFSDGCAIDVTDTKEHEDEFFLRPFRGGL